MVLDDSLGNSGEGDVEILRQCPQHHERAGGVDTATLHQKTFGLADGVSGGQRRAQMQLRACSRELGRRLRRQCDAQRHRCTVESLRLRCEQVQRTGDIGSGVSWKDNTLPTPTSRASSVNCGHRLSDRRSLL